MNSIASFIGIAVGGIVGYFIGSSRKIGGGWGAVLGAVLGFIGWIIALCSGKNTTDYDNMN